MDVGYFISELLAQHGDVSVPGLGYFAHTRINGYYNDDEGKFYPPAHNVQFDPQSIDDDTLPQYIADKKNISLASSKYFTEKFVNSVKLQAQMGEAPLADLGWFYTSDSRLLFRPNTDMSTDPDFFAYQPVTIHKLGSDRAERATPEPYAADTPVEEEYAAPVAPQQQQSELTFETDEEHEAYLVALSGKKRRRSRITFVILALLFAALVVFLVNRYGGVSIFDQGEFKSQTPVKKETVVNAKIEPVGDTTAKDTGKTAPITDTTAAAKTATVKDTLAKTDTAVNNIITGPRYEILAGAFKTLAKANEEINKIEAKGFQAHIANGVPGKKYNISLGTFKLKADATSAYDKILNTGKFTQDQIYITRIKK